MVDIKEVETNMEIEEANLLERRHEIHEALLAEPEFPLLDPLEVWQGINQMPNAANLLSPEELAQLRSHETVVAVKHRGEVIPETGVRAQDIIMRATNSRTMDQIGRHGASVASVSLDPEVISRYQNPHGRDGLISAWALKEDHPDWLVSEVVALAELQGLEDEPFVEGQPYGFEKPGAIILVKFDDDDPVGRKFQNRKLWKNPYYASVDAPGLFVQALSYLQSQDPAFLYRTTYTARDGNTYSLTHAFNLAVNWLTDRIDENPEGLIQYSNPVAGGKGMRNQGWKDSADSMVHKDGTWANSAGGVAPIEVQAQTVISLRQAAQVYRDLYNEPTKADDLEARADRLQDFIIDNGWVENEGGGHFVMGWDRDEAGNLRKIETRSLDMCSVLPILDMDNPRQREMALQTVRNLFSAALLTKWGPRVMANDEAGYGDYRYHCGIWAHQSNLVAEALSTIGLYGLDRHIGSLTTAMLNTIKCFPEHISGKDSDFPEISSKDVYVQSQQYDELYLTEQVPPLGQTWTAATELGKLRRYQHIPVVAQDPELRQFELSLLNS